MSRSHEAHMIELDRRELAHRSQEASQAAWEAEGALMDACPLCVAPGGHYARLARHDAHVADLPAGWVMPSARTLCPRCAVDVTDWSGAVRSLHQEWHDEDAESDARLERRSAQREDQEAHC